MNECETLGWLKAVRAFERSWGLCMVQSWLKLTVAARQAELLFVHQSRKAACSAASSETAQYLTDHQLALEFAKGGRSCTTQHHPPKSGPLASAPSSMGGKWKKHKAAAGSSAGASPAPAAAAPTGQALPVLNGFILAEPEVPDIKQQQQPATTPTAKLSTLSIAVPGSTIESAPTPEAAAAIAAQIARAAAIYSVDEVVVYDDSQGNTNATSVSLATATLARLLQYIETPAHLRAALFPGGLSYPDLKAAETLCPSLHTPHHQRGQEWQPYCEGVVMRSEPGMGSFIDIGRDRNAHVAETLPASRRVTLYLGEAPSTAFVPAFSETMLQAKVVSPSEPRRQAGSYWGFSVRLASTLSRALKDGPHKAYDLSVATSSEGVEREAADLVLPKYKHAIVVFGGEQGLEEIVEADESLAQSGKTASDFANVYLNCCPGQGVTEIKTEDAVTLSLAYLHASMLKYGNR